LCDYGIWYINEQIFGCLRIYIADIVFPGWNILTDESGKMKQIFGCLRIYIADIVFPGWNILTDESGKMKQSGQ